MTDPGGPRFPRTSAEVLRASVEGWRRQRRRRVLRRTAGGLLLLGALVWGGNAYVLGRPVAAAVASDSVAARTNLAVHLRYFVDPTTLVVALRREDPAAPETAFYALAVAAARLHAADLSFARVVLRGARGTAFVLAGADFDRLGAEFTAGGEPFEWARRVPPLLRASAGGAAIGALTGPLPPLLGLQPADAATAAAQWRAGAR